MLFLISAYPAVRVKFYAYVNNACVIINQLTYYAGKISSLQTCNYAKRRNQCRNNANDSFGKGFDVLKDHVLADTAEVPLAFSSIFKKVLHLKHLNRHLECILL